MKISKYLTATAIGGLISAVPAYAENVAQNTQQDTAADSNIIIVTASKRETTLQETPIAVSVTGAETIEQAEIRDLLDLQSIVPSLRVSQFQSSANTNFVIRGFGNGANNAGIEPSVGVFIDGVYRSRSAAQIGDLPNVQRIEVLRGPQSTLFGKNASAGVISVVTQKPQFDFGGSASLTYGNYNTVVAKADITGPLTDTVAFSLAGKYNRRDGYAQDLALGTDVNDRDRWGTRAQLLFEPSNDLSVRLIADYDKIDENCCIAANIVNGPTSAISDMLAGGKAVDPENPFSYNVYNNFLSSNNIENYGVSGQLDYSFGALNLAAITAYRRVNAVTDQDSDFTGADLIGRNFADTRIKTFTQELRLASEFDGPVNFLLGGYYFDENIDQINEFQFGSQFRTYGNALVQAASGGALSVPMLEQTFGALDGDPTQYVGRFFRSADGFDEAYDFSNEAYSIFGTVDFEITDKLTLTGGFNYTKDKKRFSTDVTSSDVFSGIDLDAPQYAPFREQLLIGGGVDPATAAFLAANPTATLPNGDSANPLADLKNFQFLPPFLNVPNAVEDGRTNDDDLAWSVRASYAVNDNVNVYATYATGFKASSINLSRDSRPLATDLPAIIAGGLNTPNLTSGSRFAGPENSEVYEIGLKAQFDYAAFNITAFKQSIEGFQSNVFTGTGFALANAGEQSTFGIEFDGTVTPVDPLTLFLAVTYLDTKYDSFVNSAFGDISGATPAGIPGISASMGATYTHEFDNGSRLIARGDYLYESPVHLVDGLIGFPNGFAESLKREVKQLNAAVTFQHISGFELSVYGRNLTNDKYLTLVFPSVAQSGSISGYPNQPRTYGVTARYKF
ncbi:TonB-dependent receptor [Parasphingorhabdus sp. JC815]|uniref:TonB-dependent receptor n=1 Tax=Parasphingorhabdus sp. JC815 TaxID=3232140 RepID=UPI00345AEE16